MASAQTIPPRRHAHRIAGVLAVRVPAHTPAYTQARTPVCSTGRAAGRRARRAAGGFTYLLLLFVVAITGAGLAALGQHWQQAAQREREAELLFRGLQIADALQRYAEATPEGQPRRPQALDALLVDARVSPPRHHLRRLWTDPFTGQADWALLRDEAQGIVGLHSQATRPALRRTNFPAGVGGTGAAAARVSDWVFLAAAAETGPTDRNADAPTAAQPAPRTLAPAGLPAARSPAQ